MATSRGRRAQGIHFGHRGGVCREPDPGGVVRNAVPTGRLDRVAAVLGAHLDKQRGLQGQYGPERGR